MNLKIFRAQIFVGAPYTIEYFSQLFHIMNFIVKYFLLGNVFEPIFSSGHDYLKWTSEFQGYKAHLSSTIAEWICASAIGLYLVMYYWEFKQLTIHEPIILFNTQELQANNTISPSHDLE